MAVHPYTRFFILPSAPTVDEDETEGYEIGDVVFYDGAFYDCSDVTTGAAVWTERGSGGGPVSWGDIIGTLADQSDLQTILDALADIDHMHGILSVVDPTINDDTSLGYEPPLLWVNTVSNVPWLLVNSADGSAIWLSLNTYTQDEVDTLIANIVGKQIHAAPAHTLAASHLNDKLAVLANGSTTSIKSLTFTVLKDILIGMLDNVLLPATHDHDATEIGFTPTGDISSTNVSTALAELDTEKVKHGLATAVNDFLVASGAGVFVKKTLAETITILRTSLDSIFAPIAKGVTNGDTHDHNGGDGNQINHTHLSNIGTNTHAQIDTHIGTTYPAHTHQVPDVLVMFGNLATVPASTTYHMNVGKTGADGTTHNLPFPIDCVIEAIYLRTANGQPASGTLTATLVTGGSTVTALVATATAGGGAASYTGSGSIAVSAGTLIRVQVQNNALAASAQISYVSLKLRYTSEDVD